MIEQRISETRKLLSELQERQKTLSNKRRSASFRVMRCSNAVVWERAKQRYRHRLDEHGMRTVVLIGGLFAALVLPLAFITAIFNNLVVGILVGLASASVAFASYVVVLCGSDEVTKKRIEQQESARDAARREMDEVRVALQSVDCRVASTLSELSLLEPELAKQRAIEEETRRRNAFENLSKILYNERWRELRGIDFENYVARVFQHLGYRTEETPTTGDQGVDLIVISGNRRIAIQVKGYYNSVSNSAIQEVVAGMRFHRCAQTCVVTNSRFTKSALDLAAVNGCRLVGEDNFENFVYGRVFERV